jgi:hypothetical protein
VDDVSLQIDCVTDPKNISRSSSDDGWVLADEIFAVDRGATTRRTEKLALATSPEEAKRDASLTWHWQLALATSQKRQSGDASLTHATPLLLAGFALG